MSEKSKRDNMLVESSSADSCEIGLPLGEESIELAVLPVKK